MMMKRNQIKIIALPLSVILVISLISLLVSGLAPKLTSDPELSRRHLSLVVKRAAKHELDANHSKMMHNHLSRKVFDRACAASKDTIDEVVACVTNNEQMLKMVKPEVAGKCYKDSFGQEFDPKEMMHHKELICTNRDKFEEMTACVYRKTAEAMNPKEIDTMTSAIVDVGLCIINALDG